MRLYFKDGLLYSAISRSSLAPDSESETTMCGLSLMFVY